MKRKVIQMAGKTMVISLPASWVKKYGVKKGEELDLEEKGNQIVINQNKPVKVEEVKIDLRGHSSFVKRNLNVLYKKGYDQIEIIYDNPKIIDEIQETINKSLLGFEILKQTETMCLVKSIANPEESEFDSTLRRMFLVTLAMGKESLEAVSKDNIKELEQIMTKEELVNKLANYCQRFLNKKGYADFKKTTHIYSIVRSIEQIADEYYTLCEYVFKSKPKLPKTVLTFYQRTNSFFEMVYNLFYKFNNKALLDEKKTRFDMIKEFQNSAAKSSGKEMVVYHHLISVINEAHHITECFDYQPSF